MTPTDWQTESLGTDAGARHNPPANGSSPMFWLLLIMSMAIFAPCVLLPVWRDYEAVALTEQIEAAQASQDRADVERLQRHVEALQADPQVVARLAKRELHYIEPGAATVEVGHAGIRPLPASPIETKPVEPPGVAARVTGLYPAWDHDSLFVREPTRTMLLVLSIALLLAAVLWVRPGGDAPDRSPDENIQS